MDVLLNHPNLHLNHTWIEQYHHPDHPEQPKGDNISVTKLFCTHSAKEKEK